ncbi:unnamed protein product [Clonostachys rhizophaga]|uniref:2EXR domain-containing protein n=1 Tax=Clonostachys rhizophaga TaxID=160324 RepID=A0A9N9YV22_9HYPO|nr:unnamed protein product [Clonostachys rhizophaga]
MATFRPRYETLNSLHFQGSQAIRNNDSFHLFPKLPTEIKLQIWKTAFVSRCRLITIRLTDPSATEQVDPYGSYEETVGSTDFVDFNLWHDKPSPCNQEIWKVSIDQKPRRNPLMQISRECRQLAKQQFRLPLCSNPGSDLLQPTLWLDPENDYIFIAQFDVPTLTFISFINHMSLSDPRGAGILHMAFDSRCRDSLRGLEALSREATLAKNTLKTFREAILGLKSVWFIHLLGTDSRIMAGALSGTSNRAMGLNRSIPIFAHAVEFDLITPDPRPIQASLKGQTVWNDPKKPVEAWLRVERALGLDRHKVAGGASVSARASISTISHILAMSGRKEIISDTYCDVRCSQTMDLALRIEQESIDQMADRGGYLEEIREMEPVESKKNVLSAAGFWIFPEGTFDTLFEPPRYAGKAYQDMTGHHPALGLFELPS